MENASMLRISSGYSLMYKFGCVFTFIAILIICTLEFFGLLTSNNPIPSGRVVALILILILILVMGLTIFMVVRTSRIAECVLESADGIFLNVKLNWTKKNLPFSAIESVDMYSVPSAWKHHVVRIKIKHQSSSSIFFDFIPNENYFKSALFRQFPSVEQL